MMMVVVVVVCHFTVVVMGLSDDLGYSFVRVWESGYIVVLYNAIITQHHHNMLEEEGSSRRVVVGSSFGFGPHGRTPDTASGQAACARGM